MSGNRIMSFFLKLTVFMALIWAFIPTSQGNNYSLYGIYKHTKQDLSQFCQRNPKTCEETNNAYKSMKEKLAYIGDSIAYVIKHSAIDTAALEKENSAQAHDDRQEQSNSEKKQDALFETDRAEEKHNSTLRSEDTLDAWLPPASES